MGLLLFRARDKIKTGDGCWAESRSSIPENRRGLLGCGVDFLLRFLSVKALFQLGQFGFECHIVFFELADLDFQMFTQEKAPSSKAPGRTTITMHDKRLVCASDRRSGIAPAPLFRRATGLKLRTRQRNTEREIRGGEIKQRSGGGEKTRSLAANRSRIRNRIAQSTEPKITRAHSRKKPLTGFLLSRVPRNAGLSKLLSRFKMGRR